MLKSSNWISFFPGFAGAKKNQKKWKKLWNHHLASNIPQLQICRLEMRMNPSQNANLNQNGGSVWVLDIYRLNVPAVKDIKRLRIEETTTEVCLELKEPSSISFNSICCFMLSQPWQWPTNWCFNLNPKSSRMNSSFDAWRHALEEFVVVVVVVVAKQVKQMSKCHKKSWWNKPW